MKKLLLTTCVTMTAVALFGQGTVTFSNSSSDLASPPDRLVRYDSTASTVNATFVAGNGAANVTAGLRAQLYYGASTDVAGSLTAVTTAPASFKASTSANVGTWFTVSSVPLGIFAPGTTVNLQVRVWDISLASDYNAAVAMGAAYTSLLGQSAIFQYTSPNGGTPAPSAFTMQNFQGFTIGAVGGAPVPEPTTMALAGLGAAAMFIFRRRK